MKRPRIYLYTQLPDFEIPNHVVGYALAEDGTLLAHHVSSNDAYAKLDLTSIQKRERYTLHYPDGWETEWIDRESLPGHLGFQTAWNLHRKQDLISLSIVIDDLRLENANLRKEASLAACGV